MTPTDKTIKTILQKFESLRVTSTDQLIEPLVSTDADSASLGPNWQDQDGILRDLWLQHMKPSQIAEQLGRSVPAIMTRAVRLGLPRRAAPGRKPGRRLPDDNQTKIVKTVRVKAKTAEHTSEDGFHAKKSLRICLMCLSKFPSTGRHNRICNSCKETTEYIAGSRIPDIHLPTE